MAEMLGSTVGQLKASMSSREFTGWIVELGLRSEEEEEQMRIARVGMEMGK